MGAIIHIMPHKTHSNASVVSALAGNIFVTIIKTIVAVISGSASMFAESIHSFADTLNQSLLLIGLKRSKKPADEERGYGYGIERFFWSLISACGILFIGAGVTVYHSIDSLITNEAASTHGLSYFSIVILGVSFFIEGITFMIALREIKGRQIFFIKFFSPTPTLSRSQSSTKTVPQCSV